MLFIKIFFFTIEYEHIHYLTILFRSFLHASDPESAHFTQTHREKDVVIFLGKDCFRSKFEINVCVTTSYALSFVFAF